MGGLLRALAGGIAGLGQGMIEKAKQDREDALSALARSQKVEDQKAEFAHQDSTLATTEAGANTRLGISEAGADKRTNITEQGATTRLGISEGGADRRNAATIGAEGERQTAGFAHEDSQVDRVLPTQPDGSTSALTKGGKVLPLKADDGAPITGDVALTAPETRLIAVYKQRNVLLDSDDKPILDVNGHPQVDWDAVDAQLRKAGQGKLADKISGVAPAGTSTYVTKPAGSALSMPMGGGLTSNLFGQDQKPLSMPTPPPPPSAAPPKDAIDFLKKNPGMKAEFDQKYGQGAAARALGQ